MKGERRIRESGGYNISDHRLTRRGFLRRAGLLGAGAALSPALLSALAGCTTTSSRVTNDIKMGIVLGNQILWRYLAQKKDELLKPLGYNVTFINYQDGDQLNSDFLSGKIDVCATLLNALPLLAATTDIQVFLPIAWMKWGFPIVVSGSSNLGSVADLPGKKLANLGSTHASTVYWQALIQENYDFSLKDKVTLLSYEQLQASSPVDLLQKGAVDAAVVESHALSDMFPKGSYRQIGDLRTEWAKISKSDRLLVYGGYVAKTKWIEANKKFVNDLTRLNYEAMKAYKGDRSAVLDPSLAYNGENAPAMTKDAAAYVAEYLGYDDIEPERVNLANQDVDDYKKMFDLLAKSGYLKSTPQDVKKLFYVK